MAQEPAFIKTKKLLELNVGDRIVLTEPDGVGVVTRKETASWIKTAAGPCIRIEWDVVSGEGKGHSGEYVGDRHAEVELIVSS